MANSKFAYVKLVYDLNQKEDSMRCRRIVAEYCCHKDCLMSEGYEKAVVLVQQCLRELRGLTKKEKKSYFLERVRSCCRELSEKNYLKPVWTIGAAPGIVKSGVCRWCFCSVYEIGKTTLDNFCKAVKDGSRCQERTMTDGPVPKEVNYCILCLS